MKKIVLSALIAVSMMACKNEDGYVPSEFPTGKYSKVLDFNFKVPYKNSDGGVKTIKVTFNDAVTYDVIFDTGCGVPISMSILEASQLYKDGSLSGLDKVGNTVVSTADGNVSSVDVYVVKTVSLTDEEGNKRTIYNVPVTISENPNAPLLIGTPLLSNFARQYEVDEVNQVIKFKE